MKNLSEERGTFSAALMRHQQQLNSCATPQEVSDLLLKIIESEKMKPAAITYARNIHTKASRASDLLTALSLVYNVILAGDGVGCYWTKAATQRSR